MINNGCSNTNRKVLIKRLGKNLLPSAQAWRLWWPGIPITAPYPGNCHVDLFCHFSPGQTLVTQLEDLLRGADQCRMTKENRMPEKDDEIQGETPNPRSPADMRRANEDQLAEYVEIHEAAAKEARQA